MPGFGYLPSIPSIVTVGLPAPPDGPENASEWYHDALQLPATYVSGWFGCAIGSERSDSDIQLLFHEKNHLEPTLRLVVNPTELMAIFAGIGNLLHTRTTMLPEWNLTPLPKESDAI
jgi:hypothetical protein